MQEIKFQKEGWWRGVEGLCGQRYTECKCKPSPKRGQVHKDSVEPRETGVRGLEVGSPYPV